MTADFGQRAARGVALALLAAGATTLAAALFGPALGLGSGEQSVFYAWFELKRTEVAGIAVAILIAGCGVAAFAFSRAPQALASDVLVGAAALVLALLAAEAVVRAVDGKPIFAFRNWLAEHNALLTTETPNDYDPLLGWVLRPNQRINSDDPATSFSTGPYGIRLNRPDRYPQLGGILVVGDSFTAGSGVPDGKTWPAQLEEIAGRAVANAAAGGWGADQIILRAESLLEPLRPSAVVVSLDAGNIEGAGLKKVYSNANKPYFTIDDGRLTHRNSPVPPFTGRLEETPLWLVVPSYSYLVQFAVDRLRLASWWYSIGQGSVKADNDSVAVTCALLDRLSQNLRGRGTELLVLLQYSGMRSWAPKPLKPAAVGRCAREHGIAVVDLWEDLETMHQRSFDEYARLWQSFGGNSFGHMSAAGNRLVAERVAARFGRTAAPSF